MQKINSITKYVKAILATTLVLTGLLHFVNPLLVSTTHSAHQPSMPSHAATSVIDCSQQCPVLSSEKQIINQTENDDKDPIAPFLVIVGLIGVVYSVYLLPDLLKQARRITKVPIYKQYSLYRI